MTDLVGHDDTTLGSEIPFDYQRHQLIADTQDGDPVGPDGAAEERRPRPLRQPGDESVRDRRIGCLKERSHDVERGELVDRRRRGEHLRLGAPAPILGPGQALDVAPGGRGEDVRVATARSAGVRCPEATDDAVLGEASEAPLRGPEPTIDE